MLAGIAEAQLAQQHAERAHRRLVDGELEEGKAGQRRRCRRVEQRDAVEHALAGLRRFAAAGGIRLQPVAHLAFEVEQRAHRVQRGTPVRRFAEQVVEHLERHRARVARAQRELEERLEIELALPREVAVVARPLQDVHDEQRRVGELQEEDLVARDLRNPGGVVLERQRVEAVEDHTEVRVVGALDDRPGLPEQVGLASPRERLEADAQVALRRALGQRMELLGGALFFREHVGLGIRAHQHELRADGMHYVELALGPLEVALEHRVGRALEVAKRLIQVALEPEVRRDGADLRRRAVEIDEVRLEQLEAVEARGSDRLELLPQRAAHRDRGNGSTHDLLVFEVRLLLVHERLHADLLVLGGEQRMEQAPLEQHAVRQACLRTRG